MWGAGIGADRSLRAASGSRSVQRRRKFRCQLIFPRRGGEDSGLGRPPRLPKARIFVAHSSRRSFFLFHRLSKATVRSSPEKSKFLCAAFGL
jgi:hypothetical protein